MSWFVSVDRKFYRRWINVLLNLLIWGSSQFLAGRKKAGLWWFATMLFSTSLILILATIPSMPYSVSTPGWLPWLSYILNFLCIVDGCRSGIPRSSFWKWSAVLLFPIVGIPVFLLLLRAFVIQPFDLPTNSMAPTFLGDRKMEDGTVLHGDHFWVNKVVYYFHEPQRGDLVTFKTDDIPLDAEFGKPLYLKRIVGLPGESIAIQPPDILVNGKKVTEPGFFRKMSEMSDGYQGYQFGFHGRYLTKAGETFTLGKDEYLVLGDNSAQSLDSRYFGAVKRKAILGKAFLIYDPVTRKGFVE